MTCVIMILLSVFINPDYVSMNLSPDGFLEPETISKINRLRIVICIMALSGMSFASLFLVKPLLFNSFMNSPALKKHHFNIFIAFFLFIGLVQGLGPTIKSSIKWNNEIRGFDANELRLKYHHWYRRQHIILEYIQKNTAKNEPLLIKGHDCQGFFSAYYLAPKPVYYYSDSFASQLNKTGQKYHVLQMICDNNINNMQWTLREGKTNVD